MKLSSISALLSGVSAFGLVTIRSGSQFQYSAVKMEIDDTLGLNGDNIDNFEIKDGSLYATSKGETLEVGFTPYPNQYPQTLHGSTPHDPHWAIEDSHLTYNGSSAFYICSGWNNKIAIPEGNQAPSTCTNPVGVLLRVSYSPQDSTSTSATLGPATTFATSAITTAPMVTTAYHTAGGTTWFTTWTTAWTTSWTTSWFTTFACHC